MRQRDTWTAWRSLGAWLGGVSGDAKGVTRFITLRKVAAYGVTLPLLACALVITVAVLGFTVLAAKLLFACIGLLERLSMGFWYGRTRI